MKRSELEKYLNKNVTVTCFDGSKLSYDMKDNCDSCKYLNKRSNECLLDRHRIEPQLVYGYCEKYSDVEIKEENLLT